MVPKVAARGTSFKGAGLYYLHDKDALTSKRVAFTHTENLATDDPDLALKMMAHTAMRQNEIKAAAGASRTGRKLAYPVYTYSLSWAPDEEPTQEQMIEAAHETLKALGLDGHEVLMVSHNDEPHPHIHLIVNRVHPETGKAATLSNDHLTLSRWAEDYEKRHGRIFCEQRVKNNEARRKGQFVKDRRSLGLGHFHRWRRDRIMGAVAARRATAENLAAYHAGQRQALADYQAGWRQRLYDEKEERVRLFRADLKERNRPKWADMYRRQREEKKALNEAQKTAYTRLRHHLQQRGADPRSRTRTGRGAMAADAVRAVFGRDNPHGALSRKHQAEKAALVSETSNEIREGIRDINRRYRQDLAALRQAEDREKLRQTQADERFALQTEQSRESQQLARDIKTGRDKEQFRAEGGKTATDDFNRRVAEQIRRNRQRDARRRSRDRDGGRERD
jgi:MobA/VirD2-like, nuclease domain